MLRLSPGEDSKDAPPRRSGARAPEARAERALRILITDDDADTVETLATLLRLEGHEVREALGGAEAVDAERAFAPDVVLLDIGMPHVTGYEVARRVRERHAHDGKRGPLLIAVTCYQQPSDKILAQLCGFDHHLGKPFDARALLKLLQPR
jgi:two-component system CheB/CheR fusion protein